MNPTSLVSFVLSIMTLASEARAQAHVQPDLFLSSHVIQISLDADLDSLFTQARVLVEDGDIEAAKLLSVDGVIQYIEPGSKKKTRTPVKIEVKGNSSLSNDECTFPKLKIKFDRKNLPKFGLFAGIKKISINTHCGERPASQPTPKNRIANQLSPLREFYVYKIFEALEIPVQQTRLAQIRYSRQNVTRYGLLIEDIKDTAERLGGTVVDTAPPQSTWAPGDDPAEMPQPSFRSASENNVDLALLARVFLTQALIGNYDWHVRVSPKHESFQAIWNAKLISRSGGSSLIIPEDFDLPTILTGRADIAQSYIPDEPQFRNTKSPFYNVALARLSFAESLFAKQTFAREKRFIKSKVQAVEQVVSRSSLDAAGKQMFRQHIGEFYSAF